MLGLATILVKPDAFQSRRRRDLFMPSPVLPTCAATTGQLSKASAGLKTPSLTASSWRSLQGHNCGATPNNPNKQTHRTTSKPQSVRLHNTLQACGRCCGMRVVPHLTNKLSNATLLTPYSERANGWLAELADREPVVDATCYFQSGLTSNENHCQQTHRRICPCLQLM